MGFAFKMLALCTTYSATKAMVIIKMTMKPSFYITVIEGLFWAAKPISDLLRCPARRMQMIEVTYMTLSITGQPKVTKTQKD